jgi:hypothetical protein
MLEQTITQLRQLKLSGMANALVSQVEQPNTYEGLAFEQRLQLLADGEQQDREHRKQQRYSKRQSSSWLRIAMPLIISIHTD